MTIDEQFFKQALSHQSPPMVAPRDTNLMKGVENPAENALFTTASFWDKIENNSGYIVAGTIIIISTIAFFYIRKQLAEHANENESINLKKADKEAIVLQEEKSSIEQADAKLTSGVSGTLQKDIETENNSVFKPQLFHQPI